LTHLANIYLANNDLVGTIPSGLHSLHLGYLLLAGNNLTYLDYSTWARRNDYYLTNTYTDPADQAALAVVFSALSAPSGNTLWDLESPFCGQLSVVACSEAGKIVVLGNNNIPWALTGTLSTTIGNLTSLTSIVFSVTSLSGTLPTELGLLTSLQWLQLPYNNFTGTIPTELGKVTTLTFISLDQNLLTGTIPTELALISGLSSFSAVGNILSGLIPSFFADDESLYSLSLAGNNWTSPASNYSSWAPATDYSDLWTNPADQLALIPFVTALTSSQYRWTTTAGLCGQPGISCANGKVTLITLTFCPGCNLLQGTLPSELGLLTSLTFLDLSGQSLTGTIPLQLQNIQRLNVLNLADNSLLCYSVDYSTWATTTDFSASSMNCANCESYCNSPNGVCAAGNLQITCGCDINHIGPFCDFDVNSCRLSPCLNGGLCINGIGGFTCACTGTGYTGTTCEIYNPSSLDCQPGQGKNSSGTCVSCSPGTYSPAGTCLGCQKGTYSVSAGMSDSATCFPCPAGNYSSTTGANTCLPCPQIKKCPAGSLFALPYTPQAEGLNSSIDSSKATLQRVNSNAVSIYWDGYIIAFAVLVGLTLFTIPFHKKLRRFISLASVILRTPMRMMRVILPNGTIVENPSFLRGLIGIWVFAGVIIITAYQINNFVVNQRTEISALQPGTQFSNSNDTSSAASTLSLAITLFQTPVTCDTTHFAFSVFSSSVASTGAIYGAPACLVDQTLTAVNLTFSFPAPLHFSPQSSISVQVTSEDGSPLFSHGVWYKLVLESFDSSLLTLTETVVAPSPYLSGNLEVDLSVTPTEYLIDTTTQATGYTFSFFSSAIESVFSPSSSTLSVVFEFPVPGNYLRIDNVENITPLSFVVGLISLAGGVITAGSLLASSLTVLFLRRGGRKDQEGQKKGDIALGMIY